MTILYEYGDGNRRLPSGSYSESSMCVLLRSQLFDPHLHLHLVTLS